MLKNNLINMASSREIKLFAEMAAERIFPDHLIRDYDGTHISLIFKNAEFHIGREFYNHEQIKVLFEFLDLELKSWMEIPQEYHIAGMSDSQIFFDQASAKIPDTKAKKRGGKQKIFDDDRVPLLPPIKKEFKYLIDGMKELVKDNYERMKEKIIAESDPSGFYQTMRKRVEAETKKNSEIKPIWWKKSGRLLGYLIEKLQAKGYLDKQLEINKVIKDHFINEDKEPFSDSIKQNRSGAGNNKSNKPRGSNDLDSIISEMGT